MSDYPAAVAALLAVDHPQALGPGRPNAALHGQLVTACAALPPACAAGLWLRFDFLDASHAISQDLDTAEGSFWHAIMHRREPDAWNSKYWWRRVGPHPVLTALAEQAPGLGYRYTGPFDFVDFCERVRGSGNAEEEIAKRVQQLEWHLLFCHCINTKS
ncbi:hypothetical protein [Frigoriglobus tundricola]|uniref:Uncharacterized protein n=1 Tax=Frigoriglobus tundricola TaxID=2774151 RepID=A0A6M5YL49_9BACT|nr:hypothetical protein [Frigoriglobus tundricola]QJW94001.1 hypothetical protein FTUN_1518 [Frigoriglobus tundricola]